MVKYVHEIYWFSFSLLKTYHFKDTIDWIKINFWHKKCQEMNFDIISLKILSNQYLNIVTIFKIYEYLKLFAIIYI